MSIHARLDNLNREVVTIKTHGVHFANRSEMQVQVLVDVAAQSSPFQIGGLPDDVLCDLPRTGSICMADNKTRLPGARSRHGEVTLDGVCHRDT